MKKRAKTTKTLKTMKKTKATKKTKKAPTKTAKTSRPIGPSKKTKATRQAKTTKTTRAPQKTAGREWIVEGRAWKVGDNVNTESITPSHWLHSGHEPMMQHIGEMLIPEFPKKAKKNDIWAAGTNLGCSSSRNAPLFLKDKGIGVVICASAARIFYRNALNSGLPIFEIGDEMKKIRMGDKLRVHVRTGKIENLTTGKSIQAKPFPEFIMEILEAGGINKYIVKHKAEYKLLKQG